LERLRDLTAEAAARGEAAIVLPPVPDPGAAGNGSGRRSARDHQLPIEVGERLAAAVPPNTRRAWASRYTRYERWCREHGHAAPLPPTAAMLAAYLDHLGHTEGLKVSTLDAHLGSLMALTRMWVAGEGERRAALRADKQARGVPIDEHERPEHDPRAPDTTLARKTIAAHARRLALDPTAAPGTKRAAPLLPRDIRAMIDAIDPGDLRGLRDRALILLAFAMGRRGAEIAAVNFNDLAEPEDGEGESDVLRVRVRLSKTNSSGLKEDHVDVPRGTDLRYCPVHAVRRYQLALIGRGHYDGPLFVRLDQVGRLGAQAGSPARARTVDDGRITQKTVYRILRRRAAAAGVDVRVLRDGSAVPRQISAHSTRRGFVTAAFAAGADPLHVARHAGFTPGSKILYRYVDESLKNNPARGLLDPTD
jgi:integrase